MLARAGATVVGVDYLQQTVDETKADVEALGGIFYGIVADLMDPAQTDTIVEKTLALAGRLDGVANVAGGTRPDEWLPLKRRLWKCFEAR